MILNVTVSLNPVTVVRLLDQFLAAGRSLVLVVCQDFFSGPHPESCSPPGPAGGSVRSRTVSSSLFTTRSENSSFAETPEVSSHPKTRPVGAAGFILM